MTLGLAPHKQATVGCSLVSANADWLLAVTALCRGFKPQIVMPNETICNEGEESKGMFIVVRGDVELYRGEKFQGQINRENEGFFGEEAVLGIGAGPDGDQRSETYKAAPDTSVELMYIESEVLVNLVEDYPELGHNIAHYVHTRHEDGRGYIEPSKVKTLQAILDRPIGGGGVQKKPKKKRKASVAEIFLTDAQRAAASALPEEAHHHEHLANNPPNTSKQMEATMSLLENPPMSPSEGMLKPISDAIGILIKQNAKMQEQQGELLRRMSVLEAENRSDDT